MHPGELMDRLVFARPSVRVGSAVTAFVALVMPSSCVLCGRWDTSLCPACRAVFRRATSRPYRAEAGAESLPDVPVGIAADDAGRGLRPGRGRAAGAVPASIEVGPLPVVAAGRYGRAVSGVLLAFKNHGHVDLGPPVAAALAGALHEAVRGLMAPGSGTPSPVLLVPVPSRSSSSRRRGYEPLMILLRRLERTGALPAGTAVTPAVRQRSSPARWWIGRRGRRAGALARATVAALRAGPQGGQKGLGRRRRRSNVLGTMLLAGPARHRVPGSSCIIVDDVLTTGATINEMYRVLHAGGARVQGAVVVAATSSPAGTAPVRPSGGFARTPGSSTTVAPGPVRGTPSKLPEVLQRGGVNKEQP
ncbi:ComF family protein [Arthrobacter bussei]|uniref:ComF family protein n=1 Tax=Arthrobacter bussei TaxID=2594179 RepID=A0A7X1NMK7_9MICC|nr:phosphoribosyltransferase family protein [Arthrobacter bussei]MPY09542.1 ComF family protein [Arthrobacter bussei]